jgi:hypothetical protein
LGEVDYDLKAEINPKLAYAFLYSVTIQISPISTNFISNYYDNYKYDTYHIGVVLVQTNAFDVVPRKKGITIFKIGGQWIFKHYFEDIETFRELAEYYDKDNYHFILKTPGERNKAQKFLAQRGFDVKLVRAQEGMLSSWQGTPNMPLC